jgi:hypothetical protein
MSTVEMAIEKVRHLDETRARQLLLWLENQTVTEIPVTAPQGAMAMLGFARRVRSESRTTAEWMAELRAGEHD